MVVILTPLTVGFAEENEGPVDLLIKGGHRFDSELGTFLPNEGIAIKDGRFVSLKYDGASRREIEIGDDQYVLPGWVDCHAHYNVRLVKKRREEFQYMPILYLAAGTTVTFSAGEFDPNGMKAMRERIEAGEQIGPKLITSGPYFGRARPGWGQGPDEAALRAEIDFWAAQGSGGFKAKSIDPNSLRILVDQAHKHGLTVTGHLGSGFRSSVNPRDAVSMGIDRIEHFLGGDAMPASQSAYRSLAEIQPGTPEFEKICSHFIENGVYFDCTLTAYGYLGKTTPETHEEYVHWLDERQFFTPYIQSLAAARPPAEGMEIYQRIYRAKRLTIGEFYRRGGLITLGTDHVSDGNFIASLGAQREMDVMVSSGIPAREVLKIATINGARALGIAEDYGSVEAGKVADALIIRGNPISNIRNTRNVLTVIRAGKPYETSSLFEMVKGKIGPTDDSEASDW